MKFAKRGQYIDNKGYARFSSNDKLVHRHVAEKYVVGRKLLPDEEVHHRNKNKLDNRARNLKVMTHSQHMKRHPKYLIREMLFGRR